MWNFQHRLLVINLVMSLCANAAMKHLFSRAWDNLEYFAVKEIETKLQFRLNLKVSGRNQIE